MTELSVIRQHFPALASGVAFFDGPGGTQVPAQVIDAVATYLRDRNANTHWAFPTSVDTDGVIAAARAAVADLLGAAPDEVAFGANMTTLTFHLARALARGWGIGDTVVVTELDHHANIAPWEAVARERGLRLVRIPFVPATGELDLAAFHAAVTARPRLVAFTAGSNCLGTTPPVAELTAVARAHGVLTFVDAVHATPHLLVDVAAWGCDFLGCSAYKFYGPHVGVLFGRRDRLAALDVPKLAPAPDTVPERLETGTQNHEGIAGTGAAVEFLAAFGTGVNRRARLAATYAAAHRRAHGQFTRLWESLRALPGVTVHGPAPDRPRTPTVSFAVRGVAPRDAAVALAARGVYVSHGDFYASTVVERLGHQPQGLLRAGCVLYTSDDDIDRLVAGVAEVARGSR